MDMDGSRAACTATELRFFATGGFIFYLEAGFVHEKVVGDMVGKVTRRLFWSLNATMHGSGGRRTLGVSFAYVEGTDVRGTSR